MFIDLLCTNFCRTPSSTVNVFQGSQLQGSDIHICSWRTHSAIRHLSYVRLQYHWLARWDECVPSGPKNDLSAKPAPPSTLGVVWLSSLKPRAICVVGVGFEQVPKQDGWTKEWPSTKPAPTNTWGCVAHGLDLQPNLAQDASLTHLGRGCWIGEWYYRMVQHLRSSCCFSLASFLARSPVSRSSSVLSSSSVSYPLSAS